MRSGFVQQDLVVCKKMQRATFFNGYKTISHCWQLMFHQFPSYQIISLHCIPELEGYTGKPHTTCMTPWRENSNRADQRSFEISGGGQGLHARIPAAWPRCTKPWLITFRIGNNPKQGRFSEVVLVICPDPWMGRYLLLYNERVCIPHPQERIRAYQV